KAHAEAFWGGTGPKKQKGARWGAFRHFRTGRCGALAERPDGVREARLGPRRGVAVHDLLVGDAVDDRLGRLELLLCGGLVTGGDRLAHIAHGGPQRGTKSRVAAVGRLRLAGALAGLGTVGHR